MRRVHIHNAIAVYCVRVSLFRRRAVNAMDACACCGELVERSLLVDLGGDRVCCRVTCVTRSFDAEGVVRRDVLRRLV